MKKKLGTILPLVLTAGLFLGLTACVPDNIDSGGVREFTVELKDGTSVPCIKVEAYYGIACNWNKAVRSNRPTP